MITSEQIIIEINEALEQFGSYNYHDKGAEEVMDLYAIFNDLKTMNPEEVIKVLTEVKINHKDPNPFLEDIMTRLGNWNNSKLNTLYESEIFAEFY